MLWLIQLYLVNLTLTRIADIFLSYSNRQIKKLSSYIIDTRPTILGCALISDRGRPLPLLDSILIAEEAVMLYTNARTSTNSKNQC